MRIAKEFTFEAAHRLIRHRGACVNLHGHSYRLVVEVEGQIQVDGPACGMVSDFKTLSGIVRDILEGNGAGSVPFDHSVILRDGDALCEALEAHGVRVLRLDQEPTAEYMAQLFAGRIQGSLHLAYGETGDVVPQVTRVEVWETATSRAIWTASEGR